MPSVIIAAPQVEEADALLGGFIRQGMTVEEVQIGRIQCAAVPLLDLVVAVAGNGKAQFAVQAQHLIDQCPDATLLVCAGAAGRLVDVLSRGDVVVATTTIEHDYKERFAPEPRPVFAADADALAEIRHAAASSQWPFRVTFGRIASGDEDIVSARRATQLRTATSAVCVAWEGSGGARAARFSGIGFVEIRGITDSADEQAASSFREQLAAVMGQVSQVVIAWQMHVRARTTGVAGLSEGKRLPTDAAPPAR
jgi:adenosylhomocysteine nucleosidase